MYPVGKASQNHAFQNDSSFSLWLGLNLRRNKENIEKNSRSIRVIHRIKKQTFCNEKKSV